MQSSMYPAMYPRNHHTSLYGLCHRDGLDGGGGNGLDKLIALGGAHLGEEGREGIKGGGEGHRSTQGEGHGRAGGRGEEGHKRPYAEG
jgi:hypothetical protein